MARRTTALFLRMLVLLFLVVAALPAGAGRSPVASGPSKPSCAMPCCARKAKAGCCLAKVSLARVGRACGCELKSAPGPFVAVAKVRPSAFGELQPALPFVAPAAPTCALRPFEPGVFGADSGPPKAVSRFTGACRAPPVVRA